MKTATGLSLRAKLWLLVGVLLTGMMLQGVWVYYQQNALLATVDALAQRKSAAQDALVELSSVRENFKDQVQAFKDVLLRGQEPDRYQKHRDDFIRLGKTVDERLQAFRERIGTLGLNPAMVDAALAEHNTLTALYSRALVEKYNITDPLSYRAADLGVRGKDKPTAAALVALSSQISDELKRADAAAQASAVAAANVAMRWQLATLALALVGSIFVARFMIAGIRSRVTTIEHACGAIAAGDFTEALESSSNDEIGRIQVALAAMQSDLRTRTDRENRAAAENARIRAALDTAAAGFMLVDEQGQILYVNEALRQLLELYGKEIRTQLAQFDPRSLVGRSVDTLGPEIQAAVVATGSVAINFGRACFYLSASPVLGRARERLGTVIQWIDRTQEVEAEAQVAAIVGQALEGNLAARVTLDGKSGFLKIVSQGLNTLLDNVARIVVRTKAASSEVHRGAQDIAAGNGNLSRRTEEQSSSLEETASSMEEMTSTVRQNAANASQASQLAMVARDQAKQGGEVAGKAVIAMSEINNSSRRIAEIIIVIDEIAFQTNLLALNAAVEAARAGEQGRGFAVVAGEVRNLAGRSAAAAKEIKELIGDSLGKVEDGSTLVTQSGQQLEQIVTSVKKVSDIVVEIAAASQEQSSGIEQVNKAIMMMDQITQENAALVEQAAAASQSMSEQARRLTELMEHYRTDCAESMPKDRPMRECA